MMWSILADAQKYVLDQAQPTESLFEDLDFPASDESVYGQHKVDISDDAKPGILQGSEASRPSAWNRVLAEKRGKVIKESGEKTWSLLKKTKGWGAIEDLKRKQGGCWARPRELWGSLGHLFDIVQPSDIRQGDLGNCWLISAFAVIASRPSVLKDIFGSCDLEAGRFVVRLCHSGLWESIVVDDRVPLSLDGKTPLMARNIGQSLWVMMLEKAYAKAFGSYGALKAGYAYEALMDLTGAPYDYFELGHDEDACWRRLAGNYHAGFFQCASCRHEGDSTAIGLAAGHAYSVMAVYHLGGHRVVQLLNPWGSFEWTGDWSKNSSRWTSDFLEEAGAFHFDTGKTTSRPGVFHISFADFLRFFFRVHVCKYQEDWRESRDRQSWSHEKPQVCWEVKLGGHSEARSVHVSVRQQDPRVPGAPRPVPAGIDVIDLESGSLVARHSHWKDDRTDTTGECTPRRQNQVEVSLASQRRYLVVAYGLASWLRQEPAERSITLVTHVGGSETIGLEVKDYDTFRMVHGYALTSAALANPALMSLSYAGGSGGVDLHCCDRRCRIVYAVTNTSTVERSVCVNCSGSSACSFEFEGPMRTLTLPPGSVYLAQVVDRDEIWGEAACVISDA